MLVVVSVAGGVSSLSCTHNKISAMSREDRVGVGWGGQGLQGPGESSRRREGHPKGKEN